MIISSCYDGDYDVFAVISAGVVVDDDFAVICSASDDDDFAVIHSACDDNFLLSTLEQKHKQQQHDNGADEFVIISSCYDYDDFAVICSASDDDDFAVIYSAGDDNDDDHYALSNNAEFWKHHLSHACDDNDDDHYALSNNAEFWEHQFSHACNDNDDNPMH